MPRGVQATRSWWTLHRRGRREHGSGPVAGADLLKDPWTESLIAELARIGSLRVISRTSTWAYKDTRKVRAELTPADERRFSAGHQADPAAHDAYLKGLYFVQKHTVAAIELARKYDPLSAAVATLAGDIYAWKGDTDTALLRWQEANALDPADPLGYAGMAVVLCQQGRSDQALKLFDRALELSGDDPLLVSDLAHCHATAGRLEAARGLLAGLEARSTEIWVSPVGLGLAES